MRRLQVASDGVIDPQPFLHHSQLVMLASCRKSCATCCGMHFPKVKHALHDVNSKLVFGV